MVEMAYARFFSGKFEILGEAEMHTWSWHEHAGWGETGDLAQGLKVFVLRGEDGSMHVVPVNEVNEHFQVVRE